jgi:hypothetical protein
MHGEDLLKIRDIFGSNKEDSPAFLLYPRARAGIKDGKGRKESRYADTETT